MHKNLMRALAFCGALALSLSPLFTRAAEPAKAPLKVAFVYVSPVGQAGWSYQHDLGRREMLRELGANVKATVVEAVAEGADSERVMRDLATQGHQLIFATSFGYLEPALKVAAEFPAVKFEHAGGYKQAANLGTYDSRYYEARYLAGMVAGHSSKSGVAGYVAGFPVPEVVQGINAFALGMRAVNPQAQVKVVWLNTWFDPARERDAALALVNQGVDVLSYHCGSPAVPQVAEEKGVKLLAYQSDMSAFAPHAQMASVTHQWGAFYTRTAREVLAGQWKPQAQWGGMREGQVRLSALSKTLPADAVKAVQAKEKEIIAGRFAPFSGKLLDNQGQVRQASGTMADAQIAQMNWFVQGVVGSVPAMH
jgi:simple sugar transport system substrate-binding protein